MSEENLLELLRVSRERNLRCRITGMLVYRQDVFLQVLEGDEGELGPVWDSIQADPRHGNVVLIRFVPVAARDFSSWSMGFVNLSSADLASIPGYSRFLEESFSPEGLAVKPGAALDFLLDIKYCSLP